MMIQSALFLKAPTPADYNGDATDPALSRDYATFIKRLMEDESALPQEHLTRPTAGMYRSTDVFGRQYNGETKMLEFTGHDGELVWQTYVPNQNWIQYADGRQDKEVGDAYLKQHNPYFAQSTFIRGNAIGTPNPTLADGEVYDGGKAYQDQKVALERLNEAMTAARLQLHLSFTQSQKAYWKTQEDKG